MSVDLLENYLAALGELYSLAGLNGNPAELSPDEVRTQLEWAMSCITPVGNGILRGRLQEALKELNRLAPPSARPVHEMPAAALHAPQQPDKLMTILDLAGRLGRPIEPFPLGGDGSENGFYFNDAEGRRFSVRVMHIDREEEGQPYVWINFLQDARKGNPSQIRADDFFRRFCLNKLARKFPEVIGVEFAYWRGGQFRHDYTVWVKSGERLVVAEDKTSGISADQQLARLAHAMSLFGFLLDEEASDGLYFRDRQRRQVRAKISHGTLWVTQQPNKTAQVVPLVGKRLLSIYKTRMRTQDAKPEFLKGIERIVVRAPGPRFLFELRVEEPEKKGHFPPISLHKEQTPTPKDLIADLGWTLVSKAVGPNGRAVYQDDVTGRQYAVYTIGADGSPESTICVEQIVGDIFKREERIPLGEFETSVLRIIGSKGYPWTSAQLLFTESCVGSDSRTWIRHDDGFKENEDKRSDEGSRAKRSYKSLSPLLPALGLKPMPNVSSPLAPIFIDSSGNSFYASWDEQREEVVFQAFTDNLFSLPLLAAGEIVLRGEEASLFSKVKGIRFEEDVKPEGEDSVSVRRTTFFLEKVADDGAVRFAAPVLSPENAARFLGWKEDDSDGFIDQNGRRVAIEMIGVRALHFYRGMEVGGRKEGNGKKSDGEKFAETALKVLEAHFPELEMVILTTTFSWPGDAEPQVTFKQWQDSPAGFVRISPQTEAMEGMIEAFGFEPDVGGNLYRRQKGGRFGVERVVGELFVVQLSGPLLDPSDLVRSFNQACKEGEADKTTVQKIDRIIYNWRMAGGGKKGARTFVLQKVKEKEGVTFREAPLKSGLIASLLGGKPLKEADPLHYKNFAHRPGTWYLGPNRCLFSLEVKRPKGLNGRPCLVFTQSVSGLSPHYIDHFAKMIIPLIAVKLAAVNHVVYRAYNDESGLGDVVPFVRVDGRFVRDEENEDLSGSRRQSMAEEIASMMPGLGLGLDYTFHEGGDLPTFRLNGKPVCAVKAGQELWLIERGKPVLDAGKMRDRFSTVKNARETFGGIEWIRVVTAGPKADSGTTRFLLAIEERPGLPWPELVEREVPKDQRAVNLDRSLEETGGTALPEPLLFPLGGRGAKTARRGPSSVAHRGKMKPPKSGKAPGGKKGPEGSSAGLVIHDGRQARFGDLQEQADFALLDAEQVRYEDNLVSEPVSEADPANNNDYFVDRESRIACPERSRRVDREEGIESAEAEESVEAVDNGTGLVAPSMASLVSQGLGSGLFAAPTAAAVHGNVLAFALRK